jgi:DNA (cytosine-5)-methyltransferase 1
MGNKKLTVLDLFSGAGGLSSGFSSAGFEIIGAIEKTPIFCKTHDLNNPNSFSLCDDIVGLPPKEFSKKSGIKNGKVDIVIGGPPCQSFSTIGTPKLNSLAGKGGLTDPRNYMFKPYLDYVDFYKPKLFIIENVPALQTKYGGLLFRHLLEEVDRIGYNSKVMVLNAAEYGVPQTRRRLFIVGTQNGAEFEFPTPTHHLGEEESQNDFFNDKSKPKIKATVVFDAIGDLPNVYDGCREDELPYGINLNLTQFQLEMRNSENFVKNNICRMSNERAKKIFSYMKQGDRYMDLPKRIRNILPFREDIFHDRLKRLDMTKPSWTVLAHIGMDGYMYIHPTKDRTLSVREAARIQSFHDSYVFVGNMREQYIQVGNAVPPLLAKTLANSVLEAI